MNPEEKFSQEKARKMVILYGVPLILVGTLSLTLAMKQANTYYKWWVFGIGVLILLFAAYKLGRFINKKAKE